MLKELKIGQLKITSPGAQSTDAFFSEVEGKLTFHRVSLKTLHMQKGLPDTFEHDVTRIWMGAVVNFASLTCLPDRGHNPPWT